MLYNGYGEHNIQGIGDKHIPFIQNVMNMDMVVGVSDDACDRLNVLFNSEEGRSYLEGRRRVDAAVLDRLDGFGLSSIANVLAAIKTAQRLDLGEDDVIVTVATDGAKMYASEHDKTVAAHFPAASTRWRRGRLSPNTCSASTAITCSNSPKRTRTASSTSATTPGSNSKALRSRTSTRAATSVSGRGCAT